jgi:hypothetical protein
LVDHWFTVSNADPAAPACVAYGVLFHDVHEQVRRSSTMKRKSSTKSTFGIIAVLSTLAALAAACAGTDATDVEALEESSTGELEQALDNSRGSGGKTKDDLIRDGYSCEVVATGFQECTKTGSPTYWCSGQACEPAPARTGGGRGAQITFGELQELTMERDLARESSLRSDVGAEADLLVQEGLSSIARLNDQGGGGGYDTDCNKVYDTCMEQSGCTYSFLCVCCIPCSLKYSRCVLGLPVAGGGLVIQ